MEPSQSLAAPCWKRRRLAHIRWFPWISQAILQRFGELFSFPGTVALLAAKAALPLPLLPPADVWARANSVGSASTCRALPLFPCGWLLNFFIYGPHTAAYEKGAVLFISFRGNKNKGEILRNRIIYLVSLVRNAPLLANY